MTIKPGVQEGQVLRLLGKGGQGARGGGRGNIYLKIHIAPYPSFESKGHDLYHNIAVDFYTAVLGSKALIRTLKGAIKIDIPPETEKNLRLKSLGMPPFSEAAQVGDLYATIKLLLPKNLSTEEKELFTQLSKIKAQKTTHAS